MRSSDGRTLAMERSGSLAVVGRGFPRSKPAATIVGVVDDLQGVLRSAEVYRPLMERDYVQAIMIARSSRDAAALVPVLREAAAIDTRILPAVGLLRDAFAQRATGARIVSVIALGTGLLTLAIACLGIFGVVSYTATQRFKEFGIHVALGAERAAIVRLAVRHVVWPVGAGITLGVSAAVPLGKALTAGPVQLDHSDAAAYAGALTLFLAAALVAAWLPAARVLRADPIHALRHS